MTPPKPDLKLPTRPKPKMNKHKTLPYNKKPVMKPQTEDVDIYFGCTLLVTMASNASLFWFPISGIVQCGLLSVRSSVDSHVNTISCSFVN